MNNEQTKTPGQIAYEADVTSNDVEVKYQWPDEHPLCHARYERMASAVRDALLAELPYYVDNYRCAHCGGENSVKVTEQSAEPVVEEKPAKWAYGAYSASLLKDGKLFALMTPDGTMSLSKEQAKEIVNLLNAGGERDQLRKELEEVKRKLKDSEGASVFWLKEHNAVLKREGLKISSLTTENAALKEKVTGLDAERDQLLREVNRLRSQFRWTPISTPPATEDLAKPLIYAWGENLQHVATGKWGMGRPVPATHWSISPFTLPSPPETEEQKAGDSFNKWWQTKAHQDLAEVSGCNKATALAIWLAAKQSTRVTA